MEVVVVVVVVVELLSLPEEDMMRGKHSSYPVFSVFSSEEEKIGEQKREEKI